MLAKKHTFRYKSARVYYIMVDPTNALKLPFDGQSPSSTGTNSFSLPNPHLLILRVPWVYGNKYLPGLGDVPPERVTKYLIA